MSRALPSLLCGLALIGGAFAEDIPPEPDPEIQFTKTGETYTFSWQSRLDRTYFIQHSEDLVTWNYLGEVVTGDGSRIAYFFTPSPPPERYFLRLKHIAGSTSDPLNADSDGDKVPNNLEITLHMDPLHFSDADGDGMSDAWEIRYWLNPGDPGDATGPGNDPDGDGVSNRDEYQAGPFGTDPTDYYNGNLPTIEYVSGNGQFLEAGTFSEPLVIKLIYAGTTPVNNGPITLSIENPGLISLTNNGTGLVNTLNLRTGADGRVSVYFKCTTSPPGGDADLSIQARIGSTVSSGVVASRRFGATAQVNYTYPNDPLNVGWHVSQAIDTRIAGKDASALPVFSEQIHNTQRYVRNTGSWCYDLRQKMTCISPWNSQYVNLFAGTAITAQHFVNAKHVALSVGQTIRFITANAGAGNAEGVVLKTIIGRYDHPTADVTVYTLSSLLPTTITPCKVLPTNYANYLSYLGGGRPPVMCLDQEEKALVHELRALDYSAIFAKPIYHAARLPFYEDWVGNDSGNPAFLIINDELVLLAAASTGGAGAGLFVSNLPTKTLNDMIALADASVIVNNPVHPPVATGLQVQTVDLSGFSTFTPP